MSLQRDQHIGEVRDVHKTFQILVLLVILDPMYLAVHQKRKVNSALRFTHPSHSRTNCKHLSTPVRRTYVLPASKYNYSVFNIIQFYSSGYVYGFRLSSRKNPLLIL